MKTWVLYDHTDPAEEETLFPQATIASEGELREQMASLAQKRPGTALLESPDGEYLEMSIGGPFAALAWTKPPASLHNHSAIAPVPFCAGTVQFRDQGMPTYHKVEDIFPVEMIIEAVLYYYNTRQLAPWIQWRSWNPHTNDWETRPATGLPPRPVALTR